MNVGCGLGVYQTGNAWVIDAATLSLNKGGHILRTSTRLTNWLRVIVVIAARNIIQIEILSLRKTSCLCVRVLRTPRRYVT